MSGDEADGVCDFLGDWGADSDDGELPQDAGPPSSLRAAPGTLHQGDAAGAPPPPSKPSEALSQQQMRSPWVAMGESMGSGSGLAEPASGRVSVWLSLAGADAATTSMDLERAARCVQWPDQQLLWHSAKAPHPPTVGLGFTAADLYKEYTAAESAEFLQCQNGAQQTADSGWILSVAEETRAGDEHPGNRLGSGGRLTICFSITSPDGKGWVAAEVVRLATTMRHDIGASLLAAVRVHLVSAATKLPLVALPDGLSALNATTQEAGVRLMHEYGVCCFPGALGSDLVASLRRVVSGQIARIDAALPAQHSGIGSGSLNYVEVQSRGAQRWDMLLVRDDGSRVGVEPAPEQEESAESADYALLERVMRDSPWVPVLRAALGGTDAFTCQAGAICSRPGALAGKWHTDGGHSKYNIFEGESGAPLAVCVFIPLVDLDLPQGGIKHGDGEAATHGRGCTAFWPGSHRHPEAAGLGSVAAEAGACVSGAPMRAGSALAYDYRTVHCATPNDAAELEGSGGERPVLQLTYSKLGYDPSDGNYGSERLFGD